MFKIDGRLTSKIKVKPEDLRGLDMAEIGYITRSTQGNGTY